MPKILWVALPLLLAAVLVLWHMLLRRRVPSRHALNVWSSVLLIVYVCTTAGLGIFWVANQQLPVFDWHYLFGYATVLLVVLHLSFNFRIVWRHLTPRRPRGSSSGAVADEAVQGRRFVFGAIGVLLAAGAAFVLGLRHGRSDWRAEWRGSGERSSGPDVQALAIVERYHALSSHSRGGVLLRAPGGWGDAPPAFKHYPRVLQRVVLPQPRSAASGAPFDLAALADVLWHTAGISATRSGIRLRTSPSSGALFSTELYVVAHAVPGLARGLWHYEAASHALQQLHGVPPGDVALGAPGDAALRSAPAVVLATAVFARTGHKYRDRAYRYVLADLGHALENLRVATQAVGQSLHFVWRFDESHAAASLSIDEAHEGVLALMALQPSHRSVDRAGALPLAPWRSPASNFDVQASPPDATNAVHLATSLRVGEAQAALDAAAAVSAPATANALPKAALQLPRVALAVNPTNVLGVLAQRRSVRRFADHTSLPLDALAAVLEAMARQEAPLLSPAVRVSLVTHSVNGVPPGAYRYAPEPHALLPVGTGAKPRATSRAAALDQDVIGDAAVVFVLSIDRAAFAADASGAARGYRHAFIEAGLVGERIYLEAGARGLGACAVGAFYDDEAAALVGLDPAREWVVHFAALGVPAA